MDEGVYNMKILIFGASGLVGTNLTKRLLLEGHTVFSHRGRKDFDLRDKQKTEEYIQLNSPDIVYMCAANAAESRGQVSPIDMTERNINIFLNVLIPSINAKVKKFIYTSSVAVYGEAEVPYSEDDILKPKDIYGINKLACEQMLKVLSKVHKFDYTIFRPHNIYGPHQDMSNPYKNVVALFMRNIMENKPITIFGEGKMKRAFSYVDDVVDVLIGAVDGLTNQTINVGSSIDYGIDELLQKIETIAGKKALVNSLPARQQEIYLFLPSHKKLNVLFPYHETPLDEGLKKTWDFINLPEIVKENNEIKSP